ncbi:hypothetical protein TanjilG_30293 [Lupinus angustifolius]|uniref:Phytocyanin domain-containing protein n=1 Tax=Lupinus angustifolius TaxID=3871 RepID=A0A4P1R823_LUPAN|nr:hypothetical protein TanjilG_30293 [Lupinus angustifolius]
MRGCVFVDSIPSQKDHASNDTTLPPLCVSQNTSRFHYTYRGGLRSAIRVARVVKEIVALNHSDVRWYVFGDDDTIFFTENLVKTLSKYDHRLWYYVGAISESIKQNWFFSFGMAYGGGGFAISSSLAKVLAKVFDSCIERYPYLYGSDARVYSCITELGVALTLEPGFHQIDLQGNMFGLLAAHPVTPLLSLHHLEYTNPIFPNMTTTKALQHLFEAANVDSQRLLQQTVCYHKQFSWTISVSWGYAIQVFPNNMLLPDVLKVQETFKAWVPDKALAGAYSFNTRPLQRDPSKIPIIFYLVNVSSGEDGIIISNYKKSFQYRSYKMASLQKMEVIKVFTNKLDLSIKQMEAPRRHCCDVLLSRASDQMEITIREFFQYPPKHKVIEVSKAGYDSCQPSNPIQSYNDGTTTIPLTPEGKRYFICGTIGHCRQGMKLEIDTLDSATSASPEASPSPALSPEISITPFLLQKKILLQWPNLLTLFPKCRVLHSKHIWKVLNSLQAIPPMNLQPLPRL